MRSKPYSKREERAMVRQTRLRELGYDTYTAYLQSPAWRDLKARYRASDLPQVCMCGETKVQLHHKTYERAGREELEDLVPLCEGCHATAHSLEAAGIIDLDLKGFYYDVERARDGKMYLAQLAAACPDGEALRADKRRVFEEWRVEQRARKNVERGRGMRTNAERKTLRNRALRHINDAAQRATSGRATRLDQVAEPEHLSLRTFLP